MKKQLLIPTLLIFMLAGCTRFDELLPIQKVETTEPLSQTRSGENVPVFEKMANPYKLEVMQAVYDSLSEQLTELEPTDLYVRFLPQDSLQMNWLKDESGLELFDFPLDIKLEEGQEYVDPTIPEGMPGWFYTTVKPDFDFPEHINYEIIEECYIPEEGEYIEVPLTRSGGEIVDVERAAFERLGYELAPKPTPDPMAPGIVNVKPRGKIMVWDNSKSPAGYVPVKGVKIRCHVVVKWSTTYTREDGSYTMESNFAADPHYAIVYDNIKGFTLWGNWGFLAAANHNMGWHDQRGYSENIGDGWKSWDWAVVNNAAWEYYKMCEETGILKPPPGLRIWVHRNNDNNLAPMLRRVKYMQILSEDNWVSYLVFPAIIADFLEFFLGWMEPDVAIGTKGMETYREIYEVVNHELSHASHFSQVGSNYWAKYISHIIAKNGYGDDGSGANAGYCEVGEMWANVIEYIQGAVLYDEVSRLNGPFPFPPINGWIHPDALWALISQDVLSKKQIFDCLTSNVNSRRKLFEELRSRYDTETEAPWISLAFEHDGFVKPMITGAENPRLGPTQTYHIQGIVPGIAVDQWEITGDNLIEELDYHITDSLTGPTLRVQLFSDKYYAFTANLTLPGDIPYSIRKVVKPLGHGILITEPDETPAIGEWVRYSVNVPYNLTFVNWTILNPDGTECALGDYQTSGMTSPHLNISFSKNTQYVLAAHFIVDGDPYVCSTKVTPLVVRTPQIYHRLFDGSGIEAGPMSSPFSGGGGASVPGTQTPWPGGNNPITPPNILPWMMINVGNVQNGVTYEWMVNGVIQPNEENDDEENENTNPWIGPYVTLPPYAPTMSVRCRAMYHGVISDWSNTIMLDGGYPVETPVITADRSSAASGTSVTFAVSDPGNYTYEWERNGSIVQGESGATADIIAARSNTVTGYGQGNMSVRCRIKDGSVVSDWSIPVEVGVIATGIGGNPGDVVGPVTGGITFPGGGTSGGFVIEP